MTTKLTKCQMIALNEAVQHIDHFLDLHYKVLASLDSLYTSSSIYVEYVDFSSIIKQKEHTEYSIKMLKHLKRSYLEGNHLDDK